MLSRTSPTKRAALTNGAFSLLGPATNVLLVPILLTVYGLSVYGALSLLIAVSQYFSVIDLGLSSALVRHWVRVETHKDPTYFRFRRAISRALLAIGVAVVGLVSMTAHAWGPYLGLQHVQQLPLAVFSVGSLTVLNILGNAYNSFLVAKLRFLHLNVYNYVRNVGTQIVIALAYWLTRDLSYALVYGVVFALLLFGLQIRLLRKSQESAVVDPLAASRTSLGQLVRESIGFSAQSLARILTLSTLQVIVGAKFGSEMNGLVDIARRVLFAFRQVINALFIPVFARATALREKQKTKRLAEIATHGSILCIIMAVFYFILLRQTLPGILSLWLGASGTEVRPVASAFLLGVTLTIPHIAMYQILSTSTTGRVINGTASALAIAIMVFLGQFADTVEMLLAYYAVGVAVSMLLTLASGLMLVRRNTDPLDDMGFPSGGIEGSMPRAAASSMSHEKRDRSAGGQRRVGGS